MKTKSFKLSELISELKKEKLLVSGEQVDFGEDVLVHHLAFDSRKVQTGGCFVAIRGTKSDGYLFFDQAVQNGARVIISEKLPETDFSVSGRFLVLVSDSAKAPSVAAQHFYPWSAQKTRRMGVTATTERAIVKHGSAHRLKMEKVLAKDLVLVARETRKFSSIKN